MKGHRTDADGKGHTSSKHCNFAPALIGDRRKERAQPTGQIPSGQCKRNGGHIHAEAAREDGQKGIGHPVQRIQKEAQEGEND